MDPSPSPLTPPLFLGGIDAKSSTSTVELAKSSSVRFRLTALKEAEPSRSSSLIIRLESISISIGFVSVSSRGVSGVMYDELGSREETVRREEDGGGIDPVGIRDVRVEKVRLDPGGRGAKSWTGRVAADIEVEGASKATAG